MNERYIEFYVNKISCLKSYEDIDIGFIPPILRRRTDKHDKCALSVLNKCLTDNIQNIVFSSQEGQSERLIEMISQYSIEREVSPMMFAGSVHNYTSGLFLLITKKNITYNCIASDENSLSAGLLAAVISKEDNVLYCYCDVFKNDEKALALNISKYNRGSAVKYVISSVKDTGGKDNFQDYIDLFEGKISFLNTTFFRIERITDEE